MLQQVVGQAVATLGTNPGVAVKLVGLNWGQAGSLVLAIGALGTAAYGLTEAIGKFVAFGADIGRTKTNNPRGLPFAGLGHVNRAIKPFESALKLTYGKDFKEIIAQQYREGRSTGSAPDTILQGIRLALPMMTVAQASSVIQAAWGLAEDDAKRLATALQSETKLPSDQQADVTDDHAVVLASRFALALDSRISAAFLIAEERYRSATRTTAGALAIILSFALNCGMGSPLPGLVVFVIGAVAVPLAPVAKDLAASLSGAVSAWKDIGANLKGS